MRICVSLPKNDAFLGIVWISGAESRLLYWAGSQHKSGKCVVIDKKSIRPIIIVYTIEVFTPPIASLLSINGYCCYL